ncbi:TraC family protein [Shinella oryzae]|uniref:TraC family protein n=1 Tax=Shinella oryzae TaxID=2871820 RepID=A0ABY9K915_9HYPH|nr:TraC family protein [Shinella oryzae]WLS05063.1 TraC family protein [Shinella oryzae]
MAAKLSITDIDAQIEKLRERRKSLLAKSAERFARAATRAGLAEMEIADDEIDLIFQEIALRFRKTQSNGASCTALSPRGQPDRRPGAASEVSHDG